MNTSASCVQRSTTALIKYSHNCCCCCCCCWLQSLQDAGFEGADILEKSMESGSVLVGDVADEIAADLVLVSSEAVHTKQVSQH
jgi:hypothetical protein